MGTRRKAREMALQALYRVEITGDESPEGLELLWQHFEAPLEARSFAKELLRGVIEKREEIDRLIREAVEHWSFERLSRVDLNVLRVSVLELLEGGTPTRIVLNEAIEIARRFGGDDAAQFVNGILDHVAGVLGVREDRDRAVDR